MAMGHCEEVMLCKEESQVKSKKWLLVKKSQQKVKEKSKNIDFLLTFLD